MVCPLCGYEPCKCREDDDEPDGDDYEEMTIGQMNREESRWIDRQNARDINRRIE